MPKQKMVLFDVGEDTKYSDQYTAAMKYLRIIPKQMMLHINEKGVGQLHCTQKMKMHFLFILGLPTELLI